LGSESSVNPAPVLDGTPRLESVMSWQRVLQIDSPATPLRQRIDAMFGQQRDCWPAFREGEAALKHLQRRTIDCDGRQVIIQLNPGRRGSTHANIDPKAIAARACFLCPQNMPAEERGVAFGDYVILPNPFPILPGHCTIADRSHVPQQLRGRIASFLQLAAALGPDLAALYNGPRCGASAPDHAHFQAASAAEIPILNEVAVGTSTLEQHASCGRHAIVLRGRDVAAVGASLLQAMDALQAITGNGDEPMVNVLALCRAGQFTVLVFPRSSHRPACYFADDASRLSISPAILEMSGILVTPDADHWARIDRDSVLAIYRDVSISSAQCERLMTMLV
jgi:hypothetical protein